MKKNHNIVYSTDPDFKEEKTPEKKNRDQGNMPVYIRRDKKGRKGKVVTVISDVAGNLKELKKELQQLCGAGGSVKNDNIEIQGDHREKIADALKQKGWTVKISGG